MWKAFFRIRVQTNGRIFEFICNFHKKSCFVVYNIDPTGRVSWKLQLAQSGYTGHGSHFLNPHFVAATFAIIEETQSSMSAYIALYITLVEKKTDHKAIPWIVPLQRPVCLSLLRPVCFLPCFRIGYKIFHQIRGSQPCPRLLCSHVDQDPSKHKSSSSVLRGANLRTKKGRLIDNVCTLLTELLSGNKDHSY